MDEKLAQALGELRREVQSLAAQVATQGRQLRWITSAALVVAGAIGGPNAVDLITNGGMV